MAILSPYFTTFFPFKNATADGNSDSFSVILTDKKLVVKVWGTFDGASVTVQNLAPQSSPATWINIPIQSTQAFAATSDTQFTIEDIVNNEQIRFVITNAGAGTDITVSCEFI